MTLFIQLRGKEFANTLPHQISFNKLIILIVFYSTCKTRRILLLGPNETPLNKKLFHKKPKSEEAEMGKHDMIYKAKKTR